MEVAGRALSSDATRHLLRRLTFAATPPSEALIRSASAPTAIATLVDAARKAPLPAAPAVVRAHWVNTALYREGMPAADADAARTAQLLASRSATDSLRDWWLAEMIGGAAPLRENLTLFLHGTFGSSSGTVGIPHALHGCNMLIRGQCLGTIPDLLERLVLDPAMMIQIGMDAHGLDRVSDRPAKLILDHWTVGRDAYADRDVEELSRALTGWTLTAAADRPSLPPVSAAASRAQQRTGLVPTFDAAEFDSGAKTILGTTRDFDARSAMRLLAMHPATGRRYASLLLRYLGVEDPRQRLEQQVAAAYVASGGSMETLLREIVSADEFWSDESRWSLIKSPVHLAVAACRQLESGPPPGDALRAWLSAAGQTLFDTPSGGEGGWQDQEAWMTPVDRLAVRYQLPRVLGGLAPALGIEKSGDTRQRTSTDVPLGSGLRNASARALVERLDPAPGLVLEKMGRSDLIRYVMASPYYQVA